MPVGIDGAIVQSYGDHSCGMVHRSVGPLIFLLLTLMMEMTVMMVTILQERCVCVCVFVLDGTRRVLQRVTDMSC